MKWLMVLVSLACYGQSGRTFSATNDAVNVGTGATITNIAAGTIIFIGKPSDVSLSNKRIFDKNGGSQRFLFLIADSNAGDLRLGINRSVTSLNVRTNGSYVTTGACQMLAGTWDLSGTNGQQQLWRGTPTAQVTEATYAAQVVGSGTHSNSGANGSIGNSTGGGSNEFLGGVTGLWFFNTRLSVGLLNVFKAMYMPTSLVASWFVGLQGATTVADLSGNLNTGTITGTTASSPCTGPRFGH